MTKPCAVFWDIQNIDVPKGQTVDSIVDLIRSTIIKPYNLNEISFFCVCDVHQLPSNFGQSLTALNVDIVQAYNGIKYSADIKIMELIRKFVKVVGQGCTIILLSGDAEYYDALSDLKRLHNISIYLIGLANSCSPELDKISDITFILSNGVLKPVKSTANPKYFLSITNQYTHAINIKGLMNDVNALAIGSIANSAILFDNLICIGFATLWDAKRAIEQLNAFRSIFRNVELILDSPLTEILKCIKPVQTKSNNEVKQLTFIKINNSSETDICKMVKFCIDCTAQAGSQCILSRNSSKYLWIVFSCKSDAQDCLSKVQIMYPDAIISDPPVDLALSCLEDPYFVESCEEIDENEVPEHNDAVNFDVSDGTDWKMFFRYNSNFIAPMPYYEPTRWSLLYNLFEKLYDLGAKKVIFDGNLYCAHFESDSDYQEAFENLRSRHLEPLESVDAPETRQQKVTMKMNRYSGIPWCLNEHLDLYCLVIKVKSQLHDHFMDIGKYILGNRECIFIKSTPGEIWIGFPDELICENSMKTVDGFIVSLKQSSNASMAKPSNKLLESIKFHDLAGDAYDLAFLSSQLEGLKTTPRPQIIERIRMQRMQEQECNESYVSYFTAHGTYDNRWTDYGFPSEQLVKVLVKFSKVIPLAVTVSYEEVYLMYNSWHEAYVASIFIENLRNNEVPYLAAFTGAGVVEQHQIDLRKTSEYYIINDKRKVLDKIVQNKSLVDQSDSDSSTVQSTTDIDVLDEEMKMKLKYSFVITTESDFKFTSGMITIIKMNLVQMGCPVCVDFEDKVWVTVDDLEKGNKAKAKIEKIKFKMLHEYEDDFEVGVVMESLQTILTKVGKMLVNKMMNPKRRARNVYLTSDVFPLGHFNYSYRKAIGMSTSRYCQLTGSFK